MKQHHKFPASRSPRAFVRPTAPRRSIWGIVATCSLALCTLPALAAQTPKPSPPVIQKSAVQSAAPQAPASLADQPPVTATVTFRNGQLTIRAHNSTLLQILQSITALTSMKVQGAPGNHRIFGIYGPGQPDVVLSDLLSGFDFNFLLLGRAGNGAPRQLILAGIANDAPEPPQQIQGIQPVPQYTLPRPRFGYPHAYPQQPKFAPVQQPNKVLTPQQILRQLEVMHAHQHQ